MWSGIVEPQAGAVGGERRSRWVRRRGRLIAYRLRPVSGLDPSQPRRRRGRERQRLGALELVASQGARIRAAAERHGVAEEAIAGAILFDALENPYLRPFARLGPGKVRPGHLTRLSVAELAERAGRVPHAPRGALERWRLLRRPPAAIDYIAAILSHHAADYRQIAGVEIGEDVGVLLTLYQGGDSDLRAAQLARRRAEDPAAVPLAADEMGPWVERNAGFVRAALRGEPSIEAVGRGARRVRSARLQVGTSTAAQVRSPIARGSGTPAPSAPSRGAELR
ncbi:MAG: DUF1402 family protein [Solirubrobacterales bacterium]|nr:DUF1402 family protein [Solirubrobacterales bacterium]